MYRIMQKIPAVMVLFFPLTGLTAEIPSQVSSTLSAAYFFKLALALVLVLVMFMAFAWMMRRFNGYQSTAKGGLQVITGLNLGTREKLVVIQVGDEQLLLGVTPGKINKLHRLESAIDDGAAATPSDFSNKLKTVLQKKEK